MNELSVTLLENKKISDETIVLNKRKTLLIIPLTLTLSVPTVLLKSNLILQKPFCMFQQELSDTTVLKRNKMIKVNTASYLKRSMCKISSDQIA